MGTAADKYRIYLSGYEMQALLDLTDPSELDSSEITAPLQSARVVLRKKMAEVDEGIATIDLQVKGKKPGKYSMAGLGMVDSTKPDSMKSPEEIQAFWDEQTAKIGAAAEIAQRRLEAGETLPDPFIDPEFKFNKD